MSRAGHFARLMLESGSHRSTTEEQQQQQGQGGMGRSSFRSAMSSRSLYGSYGDLSRLVSRGRSMGRSKVREREGQGKEGGFRKSFEGGHAFPLTLRVVPSRSEHIWCLRLSCHFEW